ncbi:MAG: hypothetical protein VW378_00870 [bacterium]
MNHSHIKDMFSELLHNKSFKISNVILPLMLGSLIVTLHNSWNDGWTLLITLVGYFLLLIGIMRSIMPEFWISIFKKMKLHVPAPVYGLLVLVVGLVFLYHGFLI